MAPKNEKFSKKDLSSAWKTAHAAKDEFAGGGDVYEDGRYRVVLTDSDRGESKASGRDQVMFAFMFLEGDYKGKTIRDYNGLDRAESIPYLIRKIEAMGFEAPEDVDDIEATLKKMVKAQPKLKIQVKTKNDYQNVYIDKVLDESEIEELGEMPEPEAASVAPKGKVEKEKPETTEDDEELKVGMRVKAMDDDNETELGKGEVLEIDENAMEVKVKLDSGKKVIVGVANLRLLPKEEPKKTGGLKLKK